MSLSSCFNPFCLLASINLSLELQYKIFFEIITNINIIVPNWWIRDLWFKKLILCISLSINELILGILLAEWTFLVIYCDKSRKWHFFSKFPFLQLKYLVVLILLGIVLFNFIEKTLSLTKLRCSLWYI